MATATAELPVDAQHLNGVTKSTNDADTDHPDGAEIRRQVEFYFSDENLPTDLHLLQCCGGRENLPVSVSRICGFKKMRGYKPKSLVVAALRKSPFLEVSEDGKTIKRKIALQGKCVLDPDFFDDDEIAYDPRNPKPAVYPVPNIPQTKTQYPPGTSKNMMKPTGFEKTHIEPPQTPQEAVEEAALYDQDKPFVERIEIAIQRFKQKRRMHQMYALVFNKLMRFGGVEWGDRMYQGTSKQEMANMDAEELARALATHNVPWDRSDEKQWIVDFVGVSKAFLSSWYPAHYGYALDAVKNACQVLRSFYNYLLYHKVCPEYNDQLELARKACDLAEQELPMVHAAGLALPGDFNKSGSAIFGGAHAGMYTGDRSWAEEARAEGIRTDEIGIRDEVAKITFMTGVATLGSDEQYEKAAANSFKVLNSEYVSLEIIAIHPADDLTKESYVKQSEMLKSKLEQLEPLGKLVCKRSYVEDCDEWDLPTDKLKFPNGKPEKAGHDIEYVFWVEESVLSKCFEGMKMDAKVLALEGGLTILDDITEVMCSFFTWIPNELWMERKPKEVRWLKKAMAVDEEEEVDDNAVKESGEGKGASDDEFDDE
ncbi:hypothetical protein N0V83_006664 [Neocucurbitaria cava]|uniref:HTH La-type RNA-binding domain-containing protein n=1 Tax=Neocucurbitaria cava TaxID=798079 RepID=A0A9W8Y5U3_9PLEO|nr:hypothetical protein N0V83_006664 [Neocucurbitaria cava]